MDKNPQSAEEFLSNLPRDAKELVIDELIGGEKKEQEKPVPAEVKDSTPEEGQEEKPNRYVRRSDREFRETREQNMLLNERVRQLAERLEKYEDRQESPSFEGIDDRLLRIFGSGEPQKELARLFQNLLDETTTKAEERALLRAQEQFEAQTKEEQRKLEDNERFIDNQFEMLEDEFNVDLTSRTPAAKKLRSQFIDLWSELSPKDSRGEIIEYAPAQQVFKILKKDLDASQKRDASKNKEIAAQSMERSNSEVTPKPEAMTFDTPPSALRSLFRR